MRVFVPIAEYFHIQAFLPHNRILANTSIFTISQNTCIYEYSQPCSRIIAYASILRHQTASTGKYSPAFRRSLQNLKTMYRQKQCFRFECLNVHSFWISSTPKLGTRSSGMLVSVYLLSRRHFPEDLNLHNIMLEFFGGSQLIFRSQIVSLYSASYKINICRVFGKCAKM